VQYLTRLHSIAAGATGFVGTLAGCEDLTSSLPYIQNDEAPPDADDPDGDENPVEGPDTSAGTFTIVREDDQFENEDFAFEDTLDYAGFDNHDSSTDTYAIPDSRLTTVEAGDGSIAVTIENLHVERAIDVHLEFNTAAGDVASTDPQTIEPRGFDGLIPP